MIAILGGLGAAAAWALSTLCSSRSSRLIDPIAVVAWVMFIGLLITAVPAALDGVPARLDAASGAWLVLAGGGNVAGLMLAYRALRVGQVALLAPLVSTEGAIAAVIAVIAGEPLSVGVAVMLAVIACGIGLAARPEAEPDGAPRQGHSRAVVLAMTAAVAFGVSLYATGRAGSELPTAWVVLSARLIGAVALAAPLALARRLGLTPRVFALVACSGACEVLGFYSYTSGARHGIAVAAVLSSQFAALAALAAWVVFRERIGRVQLVGVCIVVVGVGVLSALRVNS